MARPEGFEPPTFASVVRRSNPTELWAHTNKEATGYRISAQGARVGKKNPKYSDFRVKSPIDAAYLVKS